MYTPNPREKRAMINNRISERGFSKLGAALAVACTVLIVAAIFAAGHLRRLIRESLMERVTSAHYEILYPPGAMAQETMTQFASQRESLFTTLDRKLDGAGANARLKLIFDPDFTAAPATASIAPPYIVDGTTVRTKLSGSIPRLDSAADAEALLHAAWGRPGNRLMGSCTPIWLVDDWHGEELGMAAAEAEQRLGHEKVANIFTQQLGGVSQPQDSVLLGGAWLKQVAELARPAQVRK